MNKKKVQLIAFIALGGIFGAGIFNSLQKSKEAPESIAALPAPAAAAPLTPLTAQAIAVVTPKKITYNAQDIKDPFEYSGEFKILIEDLTKPKVIKKEEQAQQKRPMPNLKLEGLVWNTAKPRAIINGTIVKAGDIIAEATVKAISKDGVDLEFGGIKYFINMSDVPSQDKNIKTQAAGAGPLQVR